MESSGKRKRASISLRRHSGLALFEAYNPQMVNAIWPLTASTVAGWMIFSKMDTSMVPARHLSDQKLLLHAVHRHRACITLLSSCHDCSEHLLPTPVCGTGSFACYSDNDERLPCIHTCTMSEWEVTSSLWTCGSNFQGRGQGLP